MPATPTTKSQVQAYRFVLRRMEHALVRKDAVMLHDPMRTQVRATAVGLVLGIILLAAFALVSVFRPADDIDSAAIVIGKGSGALFVQQDGTFHPVLNLASARLLTDSRDAPTSVADKVIEEKPRGSTLGIPGAPAELPGARPAAVWTVCDQTEVDESLPAAVRAEQAEVQTALVVGPLGSGAAALTDGQALYVTAPDGSTQLLYDGKRARVAADDTALLLALDIAGQAPRAVSSGLLNAVPEVAPLGRPDIDGAGSATSGYSVAGLPVGTVVEVPSPGENTYYVLLANGVQELEPTAAAIVAGREGAREVDPDQLTAGLTYLDASAGIAVGDLPRSKVDVLAVEDQAVACLSWDASAEPEPGQDDTVVAPTLRLLAGSVLPLPEGARAVELAQRDEGGPLLDLFFLPPGQAADVRSSAAGQPTGVGTRYFVSDVGVRYGVDDAAAARLGLGGEPDAAPESLLRLLPGGPELTQDGAAVAHDGPAAADPGTGS